jgi:hypothetical protein
MIATIKALLGIASPSKVFAGIGANMMQGMALGINAASSLPISAAGNATMAATGAAVMNSNAFSNYGTMNVSVAGNGGTAGFIESLGAVT